MTLNQLEQFITVAKYMNISRAAEELFISHSAISRSLSLLESELGAKLLTRDSNKTVCLTGAGELLLKNADHILSEVKATKHNIQRLYAAECGHLKILSFHFQSALVQNIFTKFQRSYPKVEFLIEELPITDIFSALRKKAADVVISFSFAVENDLPSNINHIDLIEEEFVALASLQSPIADQEYVNVKSEDRQHPFILNNAWFDFVKQIGKDYSYYNQCPRQLICSSMTSLITNITYSNGWALLPYCVAELYAYNCKIIPLKNANSRHTISLYWNTDNKNPSLALFLEIVRQHKTPEIKEITAE